MAKSEILHQLRIALPDNEYPVYIGRSFLEDKRLLRKSIQAEQVLIVTNQTVAPYYLDTVRHALDGVQCDAIVLQDGEMHKNQQSLDQIFEGLIANHHHRDTTILALGGGVIGDIAGFAAATYQRGVGLIHLPTTLLAQVDASIGGKTAINHPLAKNMIGCFYQPQGVFIDLNCLNTLPSRELKSGFGEIIKYALLEGGDLLDDLQAYLNQFGPSLALPELASIIARCCQVKARFVCGDERESGQRALLNLGHTFAHALEAYTHYECWQHGEAVAIGLYCAALLSHRAGQLSMDDVEQIDKLLSRAQLPRRIPREIDLALLYNLMFSDKKIKNKKLRFVLIKQLGSCYLDDMIAHACVRQALSGAVEGESP